MDHKITLIRIRKPLGNDINEELQWLGASLGLFNLRDKDKSCFRIFIELIKDAKTDSLAKSSDELAYHLHLSRGTVIHHLKKLIEAGIVTKEGNKGYLLRARRLEELINEVEEDMRRTYDGLKKVAKKIDLKFR